MEKITPSKIISFLLALMVFLILNIPNVKIFYSSPMVNIILLLGLWSFGILKVINQKNKVLTRPQYKFIIMFCLLWFVIFFVTFVQIPTSFNLFELSQYLVSILLVMGVIIFIDKEQIYKTINIQVIWTLFLSTMYLTVGIDLNRELGQHYLTLGLPLSAGLVSAFFLLFYQKNNKTYNLLLLFTILTSLYALTSLSGRTPVLLSVIIPLIVVLLNLILEKEITKKLKIILVAIFIGPIFIYLVYNNLSDRLFNTLTGHDFETEPRYMIYNKSINLIEKNPFGYGLQSNELGAGYPHNIFLETFLSGGIIASLILIILVIFMFNVMLKGIRMGSTAIVCCALVLMYFFTWNLSYDLSSSYIPFVAMAMLVIITDKTICHGNLV